MQVNDINKNNLINGRIIFYLLCALPISLISGSLILNLNIFFITVFFIYEIIKKKKIYFFKKYLIYLFLAYSIYLILNSFFVADNYESLIRSAGFIRFIFLALAIGYFIKFEKIEKILFFWMIIFFIVSLDILYEYFIGYNILGFKSNYHGRIASFTGDELKIGGYYCGFILIISTYFVKINNYKYLFLSVFIFFIIISLIIGERANFLKVLVMCLIYLLIINKFNFKTKILSFSILLCLVSTIIIFDNKLIGRLYEQFKLENTSFVDALKISTPHYSHYETSIKIFKDYPLFGIGLKKFRKISHEDKYHKSTYGYGGGHHPHQTHFELLSETGLVGYLIIMSILIYSLYFSIKEYFVSKNLYLASSIIFILVSLIPLIPSGSFFTSYTAAIFWINYGFLLGNCKIIYSK